MEYIKIGNITNTFGLKGELKIESLTDFVDDRFRKGRSLFIKKDEIFYNVVVNGCRCHKGFLLVSFVDLLDINLVEKYKGCDIFIKKDDIAPLSEGYYYFQLNDCDVYANESRIGKVKAVENGYQTILRIDTANKEILIPYVEAFVKRVDVDHKRIDINIIEGML